MGALAAALLAFGFASCNIDGSSASAHVDETGVSQLIGNVYHIYDIEGLKDWAQNNSTSSATLHACIAWPSGDTWTPVGYYGSPYTGVFEGGGHTVSNLAVGEITDREGDTNAGFFGCIGEGGAAKNLGVGIASFASGESAYAGGIAGINDEYGEMTACWWSGTVKAGNGETEQGAGNGGGDATKVVTSNSEYNWIAAQDDMNEELTGGWQYYGASTTTPPKLKKSG